MDAFSEAQRWLSVAERLLAMRDLQSARTFAIRAREADPRLDFADRILAVADTLTAGESNTFVDYYAVLQITRWTSNVEVIANQYRKLAVLLNPNVNQLPYADQAFRLVCEAWAVLSNAARKAMYDGQLGLNLGPTAAGGATGGGSTGLSFQQQWVQQPQPVSQQSQPQVQWDLGGSSFVQHAQTQPQQSQQQRVVAESNWLSFAQREQQQRQEMQQQPRQVNKEEIQQQQQREVREEIQQQQPRQGKNVGQREQSQQAARERESPRILENEAGVEEEERVTGDDDVSELDGTGFWTACPYCFYLYEYPKKYEECTLRCQHCERAFEAVVIPGPPMKGKDKYFCCWGFYPLGCSGNVKNSGGFSGWSPISPMFSCPVQGKKGKKEPRFVFSDDDVFLEVSDPSDDSDDDDWTTTKRKKKQKSAPKGRSPAGKNVRSAQSERVKKGFQSNGNTGEKVNGAPVTRSSNLSKGESSRNGVGTSGKKQSGRVTRGMGRLDLNVEFHNEVEEQPAAANEGIKAESGGDDNIEGTNFFEGLDEFLSTLPILNVVGGDDKVKAA